MSFIPGFHNFFLIFLDFAHVLHWVFGFIFNGFLGFLRSGRVFNESDLLQNIFGKTQPQSVVGP
jgi:hypothetical protein